MNSSFTPVFLSSDGLGDAAAVGATEDAGTGATEDAGAGVAEATGAEMAAVGDATGEAVDETCVGRVTCGARLPSCPMAGATQKMKHPKSKCATRASMLSNFEFRISNFARGFK